MLFRRRVRGRAGGRPGRLHFFDFRRRRAGGTSGRRFSPRRAEADSSPPLGCRSVGRAALTHMHCQARAECRRVSSPRRSTVACSSPARACSLNDYSTRARCLSHRRRRCRPGDRGERPPRVRSSAAGNRPAGRGVELGPVDLLLQPMIGPRRRSRPRRASGRAPCAGS